MMIVRKLILSIHETLDGFIEGPGGQLDWMNFDDEMWNYINNLLDDVGTALFGRVAYQAFSKYWPAAATNPSSPKNEVEFAHWIENTPKVVFSKTMEKAEWGNSKLIRENLAEEVIEMKRQAGKDLLLFGGASIASTFMKLGLIDTYRINVYPIVLGNGKPLFQGIKDKFNLKVINTKRFDSGVVGLHYEQA
jgi:dihydrofolate reductase